MKYKCAISTMASFFHRMFEENDKSISCTLNRKVVFKKGYIQGKPIQKTWKKT